MSILCYHAIEPGWDSPLSVEPADFARHAEWLARARDVVGLEQAVRRMSRSGRLSGRLSAITFDDGFASVYEHAFPVLARRRLPATVFLVAETLPPDGRPVDWVDDAPPGPPLPTLTLEQVREMQEAGVVFGSHSYAHHDLTTLGEQECERDLRQSRELLEDLLREPVRTLAYPRGRHDERVRRAAGRAGFTQAFTLPGGPEPVESLSIPRAGVYRGNGLRSLRVKSARWYLPIRKGRAYPVLHRVLKGGAAPAEPPG
jgi:peptidoglycan/xylan/chitin deacetylase (PgdA/CDA1 family)